MRQNTSVGRYSSVVSLQLLVDGRAYGLSHTGPEFVILDTPAMLRAGPATVVVVVDGNEHRTEVILPEAAEPSDMVRTRRVETPVVG